MHNPVVQDKLTKNYDEVKSDIEEKIKRKNAADRAEFLDGLYDPSMAPPSTDFLSDDQLFEILDEDNYEGDLDTESKNQIFANLKAFFGRKFKDGVIKEPFKPKNIELKDESIYDFISRRFSKKMKKC